ncbi:methylamine utilization [Synechococcus phage S-SRM01]|uniref:Methylamine utilization protein n=1 Tax=Synechococcus phage S-SRM01 TaxID=2781608 RepID=A0A879R3P3_9CAUD|nr:methylamine utilization [Synechococcus phage S-SRM01]QPX48188.1 methylamine utilization protein [Synechococcus phage S-SRM01]
MGDEFYAAIKLVTGEEIFSLISVDENDGDPIIILQNPVIMKVFANQTGTYMKIKPWMEIPDDDLFLIKLDKIVTMTEIKNQSTIDFYRRYHSDESIDTEVDGKVSISDKMGYLGSVESARKSLEDIFLKDLKDNKES